MYTFTKFFLTNRSFQVRVSSTLSNVKYLENGNPYQESVLCPLLFNRIYDQRSARKFSMFFNFFCR